MKRGGRTTLRCARGFTLTEMLVVVGIILIVCTIILSGAVAARRAARQTLCLTQLHSIGLAVTNYTLHYKGALPLGSWADLPGGAVTKLAHAVKAGRAGRINWDVLENKIAHSEEAFQRRHEGDGPVDPRV